MTVTIAPRWALSGVAVHDETSGWLSPGVHLRILIPPVLSFPIHPFLVYPLGFIQTERLTAGHWMVQDDRGFVQSPPFDVRPDNGLWAILVNPAANCPFVTVEGSGDLRVEVIVDGPSGPGVLMSRSNPPWELGGCQITRIRITGNGEVTDIVGLFAGASDSRMGGQQVQPVSVGLPITSAALYRGPSDAADLADFRVQDAQPQRVSLVDDPNDPPALTVDEFARVKVARNELSDWLIKVVDDPSPINEPGVIVHRGQGQARAQNWNTTARPAETVLTAAWDRGLARWLGLMWTDDEPIPNPPPVPGAWLYAIRAVWAIEADRPLHAPRFDGDIPPRLLDVLPVSNDPDEAKAILNQIDDPNLTQLSETLPAGTQLVPLTAVVGAAIAAEPDLPDPPVLAGTRQGPWRASLNGGPARRTVALTFGAAPPGSVAFARLTDGGDRESLSRRYDAGDPDKPWRRPIVVGRPPDGSLPIEIRDEDAPDKPPEYFLARSDAVGRWSAWTQITGPGPNRPPVPIPRLQVTLHDPSDPPPAGDAPLPVHLRVEVALPLAAQVEPGAFPVTRVGLTVDGNAEQWFDLPVPEADAFVIADVVGPSLGRAQVGSTSLVARFEDEEGRHSALCDPVVRNVRDPRPPPHVVLSGPLHYASRTGRDGQARALLEWDAPDDKVRYRVYMAYEPELRAKLAASGEGAVVSALDLADGAGQRAAVYFGNGTVLPQSAFHPVSSVPVIPAGGRGTFEQPLPGGLPGLAVFKVIPMSEALVEGDWANAAVAVFAVPDERAPTAPLLRLRLVPNGVEATISVARGTRPVSRWRLRRLRSQSTEAVFMPIVQEGVVTPAVGGATQPPISIVDPLAMPADAMDRWTYVAEVQGQAEDAAVDRPDRPTPWSPPSRPASIILVSTEVPAPISSGTATQSEVHMHWVDLELFHPGRLTSDMDKPYRIEAYRVDGPATVPELAGTIDGDAPDLGGGRSPGTSGPFRLLDMGGGFATAYIVVVVDPMGRTSTPVTIPVSSTP